MTTARIKIRINDVETYYIDDGSFAKSVEVPLTFLDRFIKATKEFDEVQILMKQFLEKQQ